MKKLAIIGASYLQAPLVRKAKEMGLYTLCFAWRDGAVCAEIADEFYDISIVEKDQIIAVCQKVGIDGICTIASDVAAPTVAYVAEKMGLVSNSYESAVRANNKYLMRNCLKSAGVPCPDYQMVRSYDEVEKSNLAFPLIVKPSDRSGSLGVTKVADADSLENALNTALDCSFGKQAMVEQYIEGREISVEFISYRGSHYPLQITDKVTTGAPHFVELEHHQPANLTEKQFSQIYSITENALNALGLTNGASHSEYKITDDGKIYVMEIAGRMGGDFIGSDLVRLSTGYDFVKGVIEVALGDFETPVKSEHNHSGVYFLCAETRNLAPVVSGWKTYPEIVEGSLNDQPLVAVKCSADRSGYVIYKDSKKWSPLKK